MNGSSTVLEHKRRSKEQEWLHCHSYNNMLNTKALKNNFNFFIFSQIIMPKRVGNPELKIIDTWNGKDLETGQGLKIFHDGSVIMDLEVPMLL